MILVVADTSPLNYLVQIECQELLPALLYASIGSQSGDRGTRAFASARRRSRSEAIRLAQEVPSDLVLIDERRGVKLAQRRGLPVTGTRGVLLQAARSGRSTEECP